MESCIACNKSLPGDGRFLKCVKGESLYHLGQHCSGVVWNTSAAKRQSNRDSWVCGTCRTAKKSRGGTFSQPVVTTTTEDSSKPEISSELSGIKDNLASLLTLHGKVDSLLLLKAEFTKETMLVKDLEETVSFVSKQYDLVLQQLSISQQRKGSCTWSPNRWPESELKTQAETIQQPQQDLNKIEQYNRKANMEIEGLPVKHNENLKAVLSDMASKLELSYFVSYDIEAVHRLPSKHKSNPMVLVRFSSVSTRERWFDARGRLNICTKTGSVQSCSSMITWQSSTLICFGERKRQHQKKIYKFSRVKGGKIFVNKGEDSHLIWVNELLDIANIS